MKSLALFTLLLLFQAGKLSIPPCKSVNFTAVCTLSDKIKGAPFPRPTKIDLELLFKDLIDVDEEANTVKIYFKLTQRWNDSRITIKSEKIYHQLNLQDLKDIWYNELSFHNSLEIQKLYGMGSETANTL